LTILEALKKGSLKVEQADNYFNVIISKFLSDGTILENLKYISRKKKYLVTLTS